MDKSQRNHDTRRQLAGEAAEWLLSLEDASSDDKRAFVRWLKGSKDAADEILLAKSTDILLRQLLRERPVDLDELREDEHNVVTLEQADATRDSSPNEPDGHGQRHAGTMRFPRWPWILSAGFALAAALAMVFFQPIFLQEWLHPNLYTTSIGEQRAVELADGSVISINAKSQLRIAYSDQAREVYLESGQAMFTVAKDVTRPFRVHVGGSVVQAVGTKFDIRRHTDRVHVAVVEGVVQIMTDVREVYVAPARVSAGESVSVANAGHITPPTPVNVADVSAWQQRRLVFANNTLFEITEEFARFNRTPHLRIEGEALRTRRFSGVFDADSPEALLTYLASDDTIAFDRRGDEIVIRTRPNTRPTIDHAD
jgi:transmembrane sensor